MATDSCDRSSSAMAMVALWTSCDVFCAMAMMAKVNE